ncbi:Stb2 protein [Saccharomycopsis crataegensis]|uniref:Stb2 protein n=1 Tax=Saccharomycopsis crataegensis TaxID=43959 RepID=A0AAV5QR49_9ASCO|nr:Stb2 protein [Saccharomycopsis crataegensis]
MDDSIPLYRTYIFPDFRAMESLKRDFDVLVDQGLATYSQIEVRGYEIYLVEQWILERKVGSILTTFTGNTSHSLRAIKLTIVRNQNRWPIKFRKYLNELVKFQHARLKEFKDEGYLFVTNLSSFYSDNNLNILHIDPIYNDAVQRHQHTKIPFPANYYQFEANFNLKRLGCGGRSALLFSCPPKASEDKFISMYKVHERVPVMYGVKELVMMVQIALYYFDSINPTYCDGILCNKTSAAISKWCSNIGKKFFSSLPQDGSLTPKTVAAILSVLISCKLRLNLITSDNTKDPFDVMSFKMAIYHFQKNKDIEKSWLLDEATFTKLINITDEKLNYDSILRFKKAVNKTVNDISRKSNRVGDVSIETVNIDELKLNVHGKRMEYLFLGKGRPHRLTNVLLDIYYAQRKYVDRPETKFFDHLGTEIATTEELRSPEYNNDKNGTSNHHTIGGEPNYSTDSAPKNIHTSPNSASAIFRKTNGLPVTSNNELLSPDSQFSKQQDIFRQSDTAFNPMNVSSPEISSPSMLGSAANYMNAIKNVANSRKQKINDSLNQVSKAAIKGVGLSQNSKATNDNKSSVNNGSSLRINTAVASNSPSDGMHSASSHHTHDHHHHHHHHHHHFHHHQASTPRSSKAPDILQSPSISNNPLRSSVGKFKNLHNRSKSIPLKILTSDEDEFLGDHDGSPEDYPISPDPVTPQTPFSSDFLSFTTPYNDEKLRLAQDPHGRKILKNNDIITVTGSLREDEANSELIGDEEEAKCGFYSEVYNKLQRRMSLPQVVEDFNLPTLEYDYEVVENMIAGKHHGESSRPRSHSFNGVEREVLKWDNPFEIPVESITKEILDTKIHYLSTLKNVNNECIDVQQPPTVGDHQETTEIFSKEYSTKSSSGISLVSMNSPILVQVFRSIAENTAFSQLISYLNSSQSSLFLKLEYLNKNIKNICQFRKILDSKVKEVESNVAKLKYEVRILKIRVRDVDDSVKELNSKVEGLKEVDDSVKQLNTKVEELKEVDLTSFQ